jgi:transcription antitermination factor NusG
LHEWQLGDPIEITEGIFKGFKGKILRNKDRNALIVKIESLGYHFEITIPSILLQKAT